MIDQHVNITNIELTSLLDDVKSLQKGLDAIYLLICGTFISLVQPGFALLEAGAIHSKNASNIVLKNLLDTFVSASCYFIVGYALAYGDSKATYGFMGLTFWAGSDLPAAKYPHWYYQFIFANTAATIISGAVAERCNFVAYLTYSTIITGFVYPIASCWVWNANGWLKYYGYNDFSGSGVVHAFGGACSFVGAYLLGPRIGWMENRSSKRFRGHSGPMVGIGALLILTGFLAFNGGSQGHLSQLNDNEVIARSMVNTAVGTSGAVVTALILGRLGAFGKASWPYFEVINSTICGLVSQCAGCDVFEMWGAFITGSVAVFVYWFLKYAVSKANIDDPVDAISTHFGSGFWGVLARPILGRGGIVFNPTSAKVYKNLGINLFGAVILSLWGLITSFLIFISLKMCGYLRSSPEDEIAGMDEAKHGGYTYPISGYNWELYTDKSRKSIDDRSISVILNPIRRRSSVKRNSIALSSFL